MSYCKYGNRMYRMVLLKHFLSTLFVESHFTGKKGVYEIQVIKIISNLDAWVGSFDFVSSFFVLSSSYNTICITSTSGILLLICNI